MKYQEFLQVPHQGDGVVSALVDLGQHQLREGEVFGIQGLGLLQVPLGTVEFTQRKITSSQLRMGQGIVRSHFHSP